MGASGSVGGGAAAVGLSSIRGAVSMSGDTGASTAGAGAILGETIGALAVAAGRVVTTGGGRRMASTDWLEGATGSGSG